MRKRRYQSLIVPTCNENDENENDDDDHDDDDDDDDDNSGNIALVAGAVGPVSFSSVTFVTITMSFIRFKLLIGWAVVISYMCVHVFAFEIGHCRAVNTASLRALQSDLIITIIIKLYILNFLWLHA